ncbi:RagB/SusD family nutrient uptake outer membrane protein [Sphingobacterium sp. HJSM2_6]|uniref:RagB/SusD family nutrient uptake outer membrane protein n=1 Tax=Sphingobacterium sp. HJSM2_6 TaxID=3366264 RepID=UPI003BD0F2EA
MKLKTSIKLMYSIITCFAISCNSMDPIPTDNFTDATFWQSSANAELVVNMAYNQMYSADKMWNDEALSDNIFEGRSNTNQRSIRNGLVDPSLGLFSSEWGDIYAGIKTCHVFLANIDRVPNIDRQLKNRRIAEIRFIRAYLYFRLINFYGDVPFFSSDILLSETNSIKRTNKTVVLQFIHDELSAISSILPSKNQLSKLENGRITKGAVLAFQARANLYEGNWQKTANYCDSLINNQAIYGNYSLFPNYEGLFQRENENNQEVILDYSYVPSLKTWNKLYGAAPLSAGANLNAYAPLQSLVDNYLTINGKTIAEDAHYSADDPYKDRDPRLAATVVFHGAKWTAFNGNIQTIYIKPGTGNNAQERLDNYSGPSANSSSTGYYVKKYYDRSASVTFESSLNIFMFRYADILLMYAEAMQELGKFNASIWDDTIRKIRERAGFTSSDALSYPSGATKEQLSNIIRNERRSELALEGLRYYDIIRWKAGKTYLDGPVYGAKFSNGNRDYIRLDNRRFDENRDYLWSVPQSQLDLNKNLLPNNPGHSN